MRVRIFTALTLLLDLTAHATPHGGRGVGTRSAAAARAGFVYNKSVFDKNGKLPQNQAGYPFVKRNTNLTPEQEAMVWAVQRVQYSDGSFPRSLLGVFDGQMCALSDPHSRAMAAQQHQDHDLPGSSWSGGRFQQVLNLAPGAGEASENVAESWPGGTVAADFARAGIPYPPRNRADLLRGHAYSCVHSWLQSPGHKAAMDRYHNRYCYSMAFGTNGVAYCTGIYENDSVSEPAFVQNHPSNRVGAELALSKKEKAQQVAEISKYIDSPKTEKAFAKKFPDLDFGETIDQWHEDNPKLSLTQMALALAVLEAGNKSALGTFDPSLCKATTQRARTLASSGGKAVTRTVAYTEEDAQEDGVITAVSLAGAKGVMAAARQCVGREEGWMSSKRGRNLLKEEHSAFCFDMKRSPKGKYYCVGSFAEDEPAEDE